MVSQSSQKSREVLRVGRPIPAAKAFREVLFRSLALGAGQVIERVQTERIFTKMSGKIKDLHVKLLPEE
jgi:hypothetical protein